ncbi:MAG: imidazole glycerol phosphate synthase subunit HisH [SAR324 cluster bacterium]|nr:imidazole glycerol phosphate synthase subunit HisH [SAR324 cluster bacterium]MCZ6531442.1 imidazole glycerol phosphate synthase subunit HisH [SAR324 cluster bacterium]MCZ6557570.1 imidazole glycerol phosphate synthase subunit HisH [SAR324 cluster bacterium]MCZ6629229.1 imidazole glycerol phosphate synthase subunit HisH [SAR324 cluster bacterium]
MIAIIDYGVGNLYNLKNALDYQQLDCRIVNDPEQLEAASHVILPGVGAFRPAMDQFLAAGMEEVLRGHVAAAKPFLGICVGMQLMFEQSEEDGLHQGLGLLGGRVVRFQHELKVPQIGWNQVAVQREDPLLEGIADGSYFYFVHSYYARLNDPTDALGLTEYGEMFPAIVSRRNMWGVQFHPEKSQDPGLRLLKNFAALKPE